MDQKTPNVQNAKYPKDDLPKEIKVVSVLLKLYFPRL